MTTQEIANRLVELCREEKWEEVYKELFSPEIVSMEPKGSAWETAKGMAEIAKKAEQWQEMTEEVHSMEISDPIAAGDHFSCSMKTKVTMKGMSEPINLDEICVYRVENGKVVLEQFFYTPLPEFA